MKGKSSARQERGRARPEPAAARALARRRREARSAAAVRHSRAVCGAAVCSNAPAHALLRRCI